MHEIIEEQAQQRSPVDKAIYWEALREQVNTIGARDALDQALRQQKNGGLL